MDRTLEAITSTELAQITRQEVEKYAAGSYGATLYSILDDPQKCYTVVLVPNFPRAFPARVVVMAQVKDDRILILEDTTDKPLVEALMSNTGIPREKIVLAYKGESADKV